jgi:autoinducer 2-degrading protein
MSTPFGPARAAQGHPGAPSRKARRLMPNEDYVVVAEFRAKPECLEALGALLAEHARRCLQEEPGCVIFEVCHHADDPALFLLYEVYSDASAYERHRETARYRRLIAAITPIVTGRHGQLFWSRSVLIRTVASSSGAGPWTIESAE